MQDELEAGQGEVFLDDRPIERAPLRHGQVCRLGRSLQMIYRQPCRRSLSSCLTLRGFTVAGTDKVLLMKDRGRDGRIVIGRGRDVHIQVPSAESEVEVFAGKDGQIRVRFAGRGTIDGRPFTGEEPLPAGALVRCGEHVSFVAVPWSHSD